MLKRSRDFPFHTFLLPAFFVLHIVNQYYGLIPVWPVVKYLLYYLILSLAMFRIGEWFYNTAARTGIWATGLLMIYYFFGATHDFLKKQLPASVTSYTVLLPLILIIVIVFSIWLRKTKYPLITTASYLTALMGILVVMELVVMANNGASGKQKENNLGLYNKEQIRIPGPINNDKKPDILFIVFDEYASSLSLEKNFGFNNASLDSLLRQNGFYIATKSQGNYNSTPLSIGSTFNMQYFNKPLEQDSTTVKSMLQAWHSLKKSALPDLLHKEGYDIYNDGWSDFEHFPRYKSEYFADYEKRLLNEETLYGRIKRDIWWNFTKLNIAFINNSFRKSAESARQEFKDRNMDNLNWALSELDGKNDNPRFIFAHIMLPHAPFYLDKNGDWQTLPLWDERYMTDKNLYLQQVMYANKLMEAIVRTNQRPSERPRVVIIEGDHGYRDPQFKMPRESHFMNLNAIYFSDKDYSMLYDSISPVNTFRVVLNKYFNTNTGLLKDSTIFLR